MFRRVLSFRRILIYCEPSAYFDPFSSDIYAFARPIFQTGGKKYCVYSDGRVLGVCSLHQRAFVFAQSFGSPKFERPLSLPSFSIFSFGSACFIDTIRLFTGIKQE